MEQSFRALVKGTYGSLPRGYPWVLLGQYAVVVAVFAVFIARSWAGIAGAVVIFSGGVLMVPVLQRGKTRTFGIDSHGISLGASRHYVRILWRDIQEIRISPAADGVLVDIVLAASAAVAPPRLSPKAEILAAAIPGSFWFLRPPLVTPLASPSRYRAPLWGTTAEQVGEALASLAPEPVPVVR